MASSVLDPPPRNRLSDGDWVGSTTTTITSREATLTGRLPHPRSYRFPFGQRVWVIDISGAIPAWVEPTVRSLDELLGLDAGWDSYGSRRIDLTCALAALKFALDTLRDDSPAPSVVPTSRGGLQFEWHTAGVDLEVEFLSGTRVVGSFEDHVTGLSWEEDLTSNRQPLVDAISSLTRQR